MADNASRAVAVVHGTVTSAGGGSVTLSVGSVLKGSVGATLVAFVGPGRGGAPGTTVATSVDYDAAVGTEHVLYLIRGEDGELETNACIGSHAGPPTAEEVAFFGPGASPDPSVGTASRVSPALIALLGAGVVVLVIGLRIAGLRRARVPRS